MFSLQVTRNLLLHMWFLQHGKELLLVECAITSLFAVVSFLSLSVACLSDFFILCWSFASQAFFLWLPTETESLFIALCSLLSDPLWNWQTAAAAAQQTALYPWCLCFGHRAQTKALRLSFWFWVAPSTHLPNRSVSLRAMNACF